MELSQLPRYHKAKPCAAVLASAAAIDLTEALEQVLSFPVREALSGINDVKLDVHLVLSQLTLAIVLSIAADKDFAFLCELDGVTDNIE